jgi:lipopolysaccharide transport system ATP-binding protein
MGRNGSGKSTLLRLLAGISRPTDGLVQVRGHIRCLLATGISFNERFTGRENIIYGSVVMGIPTAVAHSRMDEIIEFSELGAAIDKPTMFYSSGMLTKLAFAVAFQETPEILLLDEAMAAGDIFFHHKVDQRIRQIVSSGSTVVMATHSLAAVEELCTHAILLDDGRVVIDGTPAAVVDRYRQMLTDEEAARPRQLVQRSKPESSGELGTSVGRGRTPTYGVELLDAWMSGPDRLPGDTFDHGQPIELHLRLRGAGKLPRLRFTLDLFSEDFGVRVANTGTEHLSADGEDLAIFSIPELRGEHELTMRLPRNPFGSGLYSWTLSVRPFDAEGSTADYLRRSRVAPFRSVSFPGHSLGQLRKMLTEPAVSFELHPVIQGNNGASAVSSVSVTDQAET